VCLLCSAFVLSRVLHAQPAANTAPTRFEKDIEAFLAADRTNPPPQKGILFIGSSIFRQWEKLPEQMAPLPVYNRAFGGSLTTDLLYYMDKVVLPYEPRIIVYYCGSNDINAGRGADEIFRGFRLFTERVHAKLPQTRIIYVSINRAPQKKDKWSVVDAANRLARDYCTDKAKKAELSYIDVNPALFDKRGQPRLELYQADKLHFKEPAYAEFAAIIKPVVARAWDDVTRKNSVGL
jgi:lysophospholipase L1-like esterase